jgi:apolipoprotein D and lipocalin family protein
MRRTVTVLYVLLAAFGLPACSHVPKPTPATVARVDLDRYLGRWYVISHVPYFLEKGKVATYDTYALRPDGKLVNNYTFREKSLDAPEKTWAGVAWVTDTATNATWKVQFVWPFSTTYKIFALDPDYRWAVVGTGDAGLLWVLARERSLPSDTYASILVKLRANSIDPSALAFVPQPAE